MLRDLRRLTGANFLMPDPGAAAEAPLSEEVKGVAIALWRREVRALLDSVGWLDEVIVVRAFKGGATLQISAPPDALLAATEIVEASWAATFALLNGTCSLDRALETSRLKRLIADECNPVEVAISDAAKVRGVTFLGYDGQVSLGLGRGLQVWDEDKIPDVDSIPWEDIHDVPIAMVSGTNGKSTTVRLAAAIGAAAGLCVGVSSSDWVRVGNDILEEGDFSGPAGARLAVRDQRVELAIIETARGGLMRRGLPMPAADACLLTNIAADHLGDYGIMDLSALADAKFLLADAVRPGGRLILNGDDPELVARSARFGGDITWYGLNLDRDAVELWIAEGGHAVFVADGQMILARGGRKIQILPINDFKPGMKGAAKFNISNALGAIGLADALGLPIEAMTQGLRTFSGSPEENPGRGNFIELGGIMLLIDFAHNPHGIAALAEAVQEVPAVRRLLLAGQAGDRSDEDVREMTRAIWSAKPDMVVIKELPKKLRGRQQGEMSALIAAELKRLGASGDQMIFAGTELAAVDTALQWAKPGDFLILLLHEDRKPAMDLIGKLKQIGWQAGDPVAP